VACCTSRAGQGCHSGDSLLDRGVSVLRSLQVELAVSAVTRARFENASMWWRSTTRMGTSGERARPCRIPSSHSEPTPPMREPWTGSCMSAGASTEQVLVYIYTFVASCGIDCGLPWLT
jgi:hypothetical protein